MSGNTPAELIDRLRREDHMPTFTDSLTWALVNPDGLQAADQLTVLTARVAELEAAVQYFSYHAQLKDSLADARAGDQG